MSLFDKISTLKYERRKRRQEKRLEKFNRRQEVYDNAYKKEKQKSDFKSLLSRLKFETYTKRAVGLVLGVALLDLQLTYVLAFFGKDQIAETLSIQICVTILGTLVVYMIRAYADTRAEKRDEMIREGLITPGRTGLDQIIKNKVQDVIVGSGVSEHVEAVSKTDMEPENPEDSEACG